MTTRSVNETQFSHCKTRVSCSPLYIIILLKGYCRGFEPLRKRLQEELGMAV